MELYKKYIKETSGRECIYEKDYFYTYIIKGEVIYLETVYIEKDSRNSGLVDKIIKEVYDLGKKNNCKYLTSSACLNNYKEVVQKTDHILKRNGFRIYDEDKYMINYVIEIK